MTEKKHRSVILFGEWQRPLGGAVAGAEGDAPGRTAGLSRREAARFHRPDAPDGVDLYGRGPRRERPQVGGDPPAPGRGGDKGGPRAAGTAKSVAKIAMPPFNT